VTTDTTTPTRRRGRPARARAARDTSDLLLDAAEALFAQRGFYGVTTRQVANAAKVDDALIYYHFGSKRGLFDAVFARRAGVLNEARHRSLAEYRRTHDELDVEEALNAFIGPMFDLSQSGDPGWKSYFALVAQIDNTPWGGETIHRFFDGVVHELLDILRIAIPGSKIAELFWAYNFLAGSMMLALSETERIDRLSSGLCQAKDLDAARGRLVSFCAGGILALLARASPERMVAPADG
jgi:AcrR family transcriptional regulator